jgi:hypothetical protein
MRRVSAAAFERDAHWGNPVVRRRLPDKKRPVLKNRLAVLIFF